LERGKDLRAEGKEGESPKGPKEHPGRKEVTLKGYVKPCPDCVRGPKRKKEDDARLQSEEGR